MFIIATSWFRQQKSLVFFSRLIFIGTCIEFIVAKASKRLYFLRVLKRSGVGVNSLIQVFFACIRPILEYACQKEVERIQKRALRIIYSDLSY